MRATLTGVQARRSIVYPARPDCAARTTIEQVLTLLKAEAQSVAAAPELRNAARPER